MEKCRWRMQQCCTTSLQTMSFRAENNHVFFLRRWRFCTWRLWRHRLPRAIKAGSRNRTKTNTARQKKWFFTGIDRCLHRKLYPKDAWRLGAAFGKKIVKWRWETIRRDKFARHVPKTCVQRDRLWWQLSRKRSGTSTFSCLAWQISMVFLQNKINPELGKSRYLRYRARSSSRAKTKKYFISWKIWIWLTIVWIWQDANFSKTL